MPQNKTLEQWLLYLEQLHPVEIDMGLTRIQSVAATMDLLSMPCPVITVAGTNGKGSTCALIASIARSAGLRVGVFSSPHFNAYNERIVVDSENASDADIVASFERIEASRGDTSLSYFEFGTLAALDVFARSDLDLIVLEVGLGGRLDAVNILAADVAVVTTIALDHEAWLGSDLHTIGREKAGIMRKGVPAVYGESCTESGVLSYAEEVGAQLYQRGQNFDVERGEQSWSMRMIDGSVVEALPYPDLPFDNAVSAIAALSLLKLNINQRQLSQGLSSASLTGRYQKMRLRNVQGSLVDICLDVAHNPQAAQYLATKLAQDLPPGQLHIVIAMLEDKDVDGVLQALSTLPKQGVQWWVAQVDAPRACPVERLAAQLQTLQARVNSSDSVAQAFESALMQSEEGDRVLVVGSFYTVADVLAHIDKNKI